MYCDVPNHDPLSFFINCLLQIAFFFVINGTAVCHYAHIYTTTTVVWATREKLAGNGFVNVLECQQRQIWRERERVR